MLIERAATAPVREAEVEGLVYREGFSVVDISAGIAMNTIPDRCRLSVNYRFAPDLSAEDALDRALRILAGLPADGDERAPTITAGTGPVEVEPRQPTGHRCSLT